MNKIENSIVQIMVQKTEIDLNHPLNIFKNIQSSGTGFLISKNEILTCYHVIDNSLNIKIKLNEIEKSAQVKYVFPDDDLAVLEFINDFKDYNVLDYKITTTKENSEVLTVGFPYSSKTVIITKGIISGYQDSVIQTDSPLNSGNSGGPILDGNKYIGVNQSKMIGDASNVGFSIPIFRFLIYWKLNNNKLQKINLKPNLLFKYQKIKQKEYFKIDGVIVTKIHNLSPLKKSGIEIGDIIVSINSSNINNDGYLKFEFFPEKIELCDLHLWFIDGDIINIKYYSIKNKNYFSTKTTFKNIITNLPNYYYSLSDPYYYENNGLIISIVTKYHYENFKTLDLTILQKIKIYERIGDYKNLFTIYLSDINYSKLKFTDYPVGDIILEINDILITDINIFKQVIKNPIKKFKTINNEVYFV
jgi:S1-C subfamily serine protease